MPTALVAILRDGPGHAEAVIEQHRALQPYLSIREVQISSPRVCATISTPILLELLALNPRIALLQLHNVSPSMAAIPSSSYVFQNLASLTLHPSGASLYDTGMLFSLFRFMPHLRALELGMAHYGPFPDSDAGGYMPTPPFSLESFIYRGCIPVSACAHIVQSSSDTLRTLHIHDVWHHNGGILSEAVEEALFGSLLAVAPQLRDFHVALPSLGTSEFVERMQQVFAAFATMTSLSISAHTSLEGTIQPLIDSAPPSIAIQHLRLEYDSVDIPLDCLCCAPQLRKLRTLSLVGFLTSEKYTQALLDHCRKRRIRWL